MSNKTNTTKPNNAEPRYVVTNWSKPTAEIKHNGHGCIVRKVKTTGVAQLHLTPRQSEYLEKAMNEGKEIRIVSANAKVDEFVRLFPIINLDGTKMLLCAKAMGNIGEIVYGDKEFTITKNGKELSHDEFETFRAESKDRRVHITPDMVVKCPNCGTEFRVGKQLQ